MTGRGRGGAGKRGGKGGAGKGGSAKSGGKGSSLHVSVQRTPTIRLKRKKGRTNSQQRWLQRQLNDPFVIEARRRGLRSRAAFKLMELNERFDLLKPGARVVDLGAAPGGWSQVSADIVGPKGSIVGIDLLPIDPIEGVVFIEGDFLDPEAPDHLMRELGGAADLVLSDMAASSSGHAGTDHLKIIALAETAFYFATTVLTPGGAFVAKVLQGGTEQGLRTLLQKHFTKVVHAKPEASRKESAEQYVVAIGFRVV
ncbi:MAG: RlmE family RNA methyltransferase [Alphaproteobacteria bacterium]|jgi:23S rRNA (uridine2552-2'-O)-methyltransferase|nr:RlmE family RNA methyltransferase [Alphaproteobacteria bacterium]